MQPLASGTLFAGHRIESLAGRGGMGVVYVATHVALSRQVALKVITPDLAADAQFRERFQHESRIAASIDHPHVIPIYHAGEEDGQLFITMRYVEGTDLRRLVSERGALDPARAATIVAQVADALDAAHGRGLVHRDVKPANVLIAFRYGREDCYLTDFGLTKQAGTDGGLTKTGQWVGTIDYVAPEQIHGQPVDARADVYALGCVLFHLLTGQIPYPRDSDVAKMFAHVNDPPPPLPSNLPAALDAVVRRALAKQPSERYPSAGDLGRAAVAAVQGSVPAAAERSVAVGSAAPAATMVGAAPAAGDPPTAALPASQPPDSQPPGVPPPPQPPYWSPPGGYSQPPTGEYPRGKSRAGLWAVAAVVLALGAGVGVLAAAGTFSSGDSSGDTTRVTTMKQSSTGGSTRAPRTQPRVASSQVAGVLHAYENAYTGENTAALGALLTDDVVRVSNNASGSATGKSAVLSVYAGQFSQTDSPVYTFENATIATGVGQAQVNARYRIKSAAGELTGSAKLHLVAHNGGLLIDRINVDSDS